MVSKEDIEHVAKLMRIDIDDSNEYFERVQKVLSYFDILDKADIDTEEIPVQKINIDDLREDKYEKFDDSLIEQLKNYRGSYVKAPKMN
ncbi:MAG: aspartyl/glutamyl-tRNA amidotransferase subunit C [Candidatus Nitrosotenuis sp.]